MIILSALAGDDTPHPRLVAASPEEDVLGVSFYLMEVVEGFNVTTGMPRLHASDPELRRAMGFSMVDGLLKLGRVDVSETPLAGLGRSEGFLERQVGRWRRQFESYEAFERWPGGADIPGVTEIGGWLQERCPAGYAPGLMHGDYHLANVLFRNDGPELAAIVDWELATVGDPLLDLAWLLTTWPRPDDPTSMKIDPWDGFPDTYELFAAYAEKTDRDVKAMPWYLVLACYKLGILLEGTFARACEGKADRATGERFHARTVALFTRALEQIG